MNEFPTDRDIERLNSYEVDLKFTGPEPAEKLPTHLRVRLVCTALFMVAKNMDITEEVLMGELAVLLGSGVGSRMAIVEREPNPQNSGTYNAVMGEMRRSLSASYERASSPSMAEAQRRGGFNGH